MMDPRGLVLGILLYAAMLLAGAGLWAVLETWPVGIDADGVVDVLRSLLVVVELALLAAVAAVRTRASRDEAAPPADDAS